MSVSVRVVWHRQAFTAMVSDQGIVDDIESRGEFVLDRARASDVDERWFWSNADLTRRGKVPRYAILASGVKQARDFDDAVAVLLAAVDAARGARRGSSGRGRT